MRLFAPAKWIEEIDTINRRVEARHEENEKRFDRIENSLSAVVANLKLVIAMLVANAGLLAWIAQHHHV